MENSNEILNELNSISPLLASFKKVNIFTVPAGYFETISDTVLICIAEENPILKPLSTSVLNNIPENYFDNLANNILGKLKSGTEFETKELSSVLSTFSKNNLFEIPENYFETLPAAILKKVSDKKATPVFSLSKSRLLIKYAAAAMITGAVALGIYKYSNQPKVAATEIAATIQLDPSIINGKNMDNSRFDNTLENLSGEDIAQYLIKNGNYNDVASLSNNLDEKYLPNMEEYLINDKTLDNFLSEVEIKNTTN